MFNRQPFNRGKFNVSNTTSNSSSGIGLMLMKTKPLMAQRTLSVKGIANMYMKDITKATIVKSNKGMASIELGTVGVGTKVLIVASDISSMVMTTESIQSLAGESMIMLENINLLPGDELIINTCEMTVTINGQNAMEYFSSESDFFSFLNGINELVYSDTESEREIFLDAIWKDRWL